MPYTEIQRFPNMTWNNTYMRQRTHHRMCDWILYLFNQWRTWNATGKNAIWKQTSENVRTKSYFSSVISSFKMLFLFIFQGDPLWSSRSGHQRSRRCLKPCSTLWSPQLASSSSWSPRFSAIYTNVNTAAGATRLHLSFSCETNPSLHNPAGFHRRARIRRE